MFSAAAEQLWMFVWLTGLVEFVVPNVHVSGPLGLVLYTGVPKSAVVPSMVMHGEAGVTVAATVPEPSADADVGTTTIGTSTVAKTAIRRVGSRNFPISRRSGLGASSARFGQVPTPRTWCPSSHFMTDPFCSVS